MIRAYVLFLSCVFPAALNAQDIVVRSGEHADFSRLVFQTPEPTDWRFSRVNGGYEFRSDEVDTVFDVSRVFDFIPRSRIQNITSKNGGHLFLRVSCDCHADAFELRAGRIVLDIKDGPPDDNSKFETAFQTSPPTIADQNQSRRREFQTQHEVDRKNELDQSYRFPTGKRGVGTPEVSVQLSVGVAQEQITFYDTISDLGQEITPAENQPNGLAALQSKVTKQPTENGSHPNSVELTTLLFIPNFVPQPILPLFQKNLAQKALLQNLQRAAAQGLVSVQLKRKAVIGHDSSKTKTLPENNQIEHNVATQESDHLYIETVVDRDTPRTDQINKLTNAGASCLPEEFFDIRDWGGDSNVISPFGDMRATLISEFDKLDIEVFRQLVRREVYLGFGAEAKSLINTFKESSVEFKVLQEMSDILDEKLSSPADILKTQIGCQTQAALWAILAFEDTPKTSRIEFDSAIRAFSGLPVHLRRLLGPRFVNQMLGLDKLEAAITIRNMIKRSSAETNESIKLVEVKLATKMKNLDDAIENLNAIVAADGPQAPYALVQLIEIQIELDLPVSKSDAELADVFAVEYRETEIGHKLLQVAINGFSENGEIQKSFERIEMFLHNNDISNAEAERLWSNTHIRNTTSSSDEVFLTMVYRFPFAESQIREVSREARYLVSKRLLELGFSEDSNDIVFGGDHSMESQEKLLLSELALQRDLPELAENYLQEVSIQVSKLLLARINEMKGNFSQAADYYAELGMKEEQQRVAWLDEDMTQLAAMGEGGRNEIARLILEQKLKTSKIETANFADLGVNSQDSMIFGLSGVQKLLEQSMESRNAFADLLKN